MIDSEHIRLFPLEHTVLERAAAIQQACHPHIPWRTLDALQVATCDLNRGGDLSATDGRMRAACQQLGLAQMPATMDLLAAPQ